MKKGNRAISNVVTGIFMVFIAIGLIILLYSFIIPLIKDNTKKINADILNSRIDIIKDLSAINGTLNILKISLKKTGVANLSYIKVIIYKDNESLEYNIFDFPYNLETKEYNLNITQLKSPSEVYIYPVYVDLSVGIGIKEKIDKIMSGSIDLNKIPISPVVKDINKCFSLYFCSDYSACKVYYNIDNIISNNITLKGEYYKTCIDKNNCNPDIIERKECNNNEIIRLKKINISGKEFIEVYDKNNRKKFSLEYIKGQNNLLNIDLPFD